MRWLLLFLLLFLCACGTPTWMPQPVQVYSIKGLIATSVRLQGQIPLPIEPYPGIHPGLLLGVYGEPRKLNDWLFGLGVTVHF